MAMTNTIQHPKFKRLRKRLGVNVAQTLGHLECLWQYTHGTGTPEYKREDIEAVAEWDDTDGLLLDSLLETGWLDDAGDGKVVVHNYWKNAPQWVKDKVRKREIREKYRGQVQDMSGEKAKSDGHVQDAADKNGTERNRTERNRNKKADTETRAEEEDPQESASESADAYASSFRSEQADGQAGGVGPKSTGEVLAGLGFGVEQRKQFFRGVADRIMRATMDSEEYRRWWFAVAQKMHAADGAQHLEECVMRLEDAASPAQRKAKDVGAFKNPSAWLTKQCHQWLQSHGLAMPPPPGKARSRQ